MGTTLATRLRALWLVCLLVLAPAGPLGLVLSGHATGEDALATRHEEPSQTSGSHQRTPWLCRLSSDATSIMSNQNSTHSASRARLTPERGEAGAGISRF